MMKIIFITLFLIIIQSISSNKHKNLKNDINKGIDLNKGRI